MIFLQLTNFPPSNRTGICLVLVKTALPQQKWAFPALVARFGSKLLENIFISISQCEQFLRQFSIFAVRDWLIQNHSVRATSYSASIIAYSDDGRPFQINNYRLRVDSTLKLSDSNIHRIGHHGKDAVLSRIVRTTHGYSEWDESKVGFADFRKRIPVAGWSGWEAIIQTRNPREYKCLDNLPFSPDFSKMLGTCVSWSTLWDHIRPPGNLCDLIIA